MDPFRGQFCCTPDPYLSHHLGYFNPMPPTVQCQIMDRTDLVIIFCAVVIIHLLALLEIPRVHAVFDAKELSIKDI